MLTFGAYLVAERIGVSGVLAVVGAGVVGGSVLANYWEYLAFFAGCWCSLLIGLDVNLRQVLASLGLIVIVVLAVLFSRALVVYGLTGLVNRLRTRKLSWSYLHVLFWGGRRGAIGLALVLRLPSTLAERDLLRVMAYGLVLSTLLAQGTTMQPLLRRLGLMSRDEVTLEFQRHRGRLMAARAARESVVPLYLPAC